MGEFIWRCGTGPSADALLVNGSGGFIIAGQANGQLALLHYGVNEGQGGSAPTLASLSEQFITENTATATSTTFTDSNVGDTLAIGMRSEAGQARNSGPPELPRG